MTVGMKEYMHAPNFTGMTDAGVYEGEPRLLFRGAPPLVEEAPPFQLKKVDFTAVKYVKQRYTAVHERLDSLFPLGECGRPCYFQALFNSSPDPRNAKP